MCELNLPELLNIPSPTLFKFSFFEVQREEKKDNCKQRERKT